MAHVDEQVRLMTGTDSGEDTPESVQPIANEEVLDAIGLGRSIEHLRRRTEVLRRALENANYFFDYDRALLLQATGAFTFTQPTSGRYVLTLATGATLYIHPALTPGAVSGGRWYGGRVFCANDLEGGVWTPYSGTLGTNDLTLTTDSRYTGQRGYADGDTFAGSSTARSLGANRITVDLIADPTLTGGSASISATVTKQPTTHVTITYGTATTATTLAQLISWINADRSSQGAYGVADLLYASSTGVTTNAPTPFSDGQVQGGYDAEVHAIPANLFDAFFSALDASGEVANRLREGEGLALSYSQGVVDTAGYLGGRRQSIKDLPTNRTGTSVDNTSPSSGYLLFSTGREPEKIPNAIPLGKVVNGEFVFIDGTRLAPGETLYLGESRSTYAVLAILTAGASGARRIGYEGSGSWNSDASASLNPSLAASSVYAALSQIVADLANQSSSQSGGRRVGNEALTGTANSLQTSEHTLSLSAGSLRAQLLALLNTTNKGVNARVSELGHTMRGNLPLQKDGMADIDVSAGVQFLQYLMLPEELQTVTGSSQYAEAIFTPLKYTISGTDNIDIEEPATVASATVLAFSSMSSARMIAVFSHIPMVYDATNTRSVYMLYAKVDFSGTAVDATPGIYAVINRDTSLVEITLQNLDGTNPDFTGATGVAVTLLTARVIGRDHRHSFLRMFDFVGATAPQANPQAVIGAGHVDARLVDVYTPSGINGTLAMRVFPNRIEFGSKSTVDLLANGDKVLLDGVETSTVVDATASHHHGSTYSGLIPVTPEVDTDALNSISGTPPGTSVAVTGPAGTVVTGVIINYHLTVLSTGAGAVNIAIHFMNIDSDITGTMYVEWTATGASEQRDIYGQVTLPIVDSEYYLYRGASSNVDLAGSTYETSLTAKFVGRS